jgi:hypothetical protein
LIASWQPVGPTELPARLAEWLAGSEEILRVAVDGAPCTSPDEFAVGLVEPLRRLGHPVAHVRAADFWRDASLRFEHGHDDVESYLTWLDTDALRREVLGPARDSGSYLPSLRDPATNRSTREPARALEPRTVLLVSGSLLLGAGLPFDRRVHLEMSAAARARRTPAEESWTLPAFDRYDAAVRPGEVADVVIRVDRRVPALRGPA